LAVRFFRSCPGVFDVVWGFKFEIPLPLSIPCTACNGESERRPQGKGRTLCPGVPMVFIQLYPTAKIRSWSAMISAMQCCSAVPCSDMLWELPALHSRLPPTTTSWYPNALHSQMSINKVQRHQSNTMCATQTVICSQLALTILQWLLHCSGNVVYSRLP
jgi:hypothetical protein